MYRTSDTVAALGSSRRGCGSDRLGDGLHRDGRCIALVHAAKIDARRDSRSATVALEYHGGDAARGHLSNGALCPVFEMNVIGQLTPSSS